MKQNNRFLLRLCLTAVLAAVYTTISLALAPITYGNIQIRIAEALTLLPILFPEAILGVTLGCALTNLIGAMMGINILGFMDVFVGTAATLIAALLTYYLRKITFANQPILSALMPVLLNGLIIGAELSFVLMPDAFFVGWMIFGLEVAMGEAIACFVFGLPLIHMLKKADLVKRFGLKSE